MRLFLKNNKTLLFAATLLCVLTLSGVGYPNDETVIIGPDVRNDAPTLYDLHLESPARTSMGGEFTVRLSIDVADSFQAESEATLSVTGGTLENEQTQKLSPDAIWKIRATSDSLVGLVVSVETKLSPKDDEKSVTTYLDTVTGSTQIASAPSQNSLRANDLRVTSPSNTRNIFLIIGGVILGGVLLGFAWYGFKKKSSKKD